MEQLFSAFGIQWKLLLVQALNFGVVLLALWWFLYRPVMKVLAKRRELVAKGVEDARKAAEVFASADARAAATAAKAEAGAEEITQAARAAAARSRAELLADAENRAAQVMKDAQARAAEAAARALRESEKEIARLAVLAAEKVLREKQKA